MELKPSIFSSWISRDRVGRTSGCLEDDLGGANRFIQFETGSASIATRTFLREIWDLLSEDYKFFIVLPKGLKEFRYATELEVFWSASNVLLEPRTQNGLYRVERKCGELIDGGGREVGRFLGVKAPSQGGREYHGSHQPLNRQSAPGRD